MHAKSRSVCLSHASRRDPISGVATRPGSSVPASVSCACSSPSQLTSLVLQLRAWQTIVTRERFKALPVVSITERIQEGVRHSLMMTGEILQTKG